MFNCVSLVDELYRKNWVGICRRNSLFYSAELLAGNLSEQESENVRCICPSPNCLRDNPEGQIAGERVELTLEWFHSG
jgi:hypothetical protein